MTEERRGSSGLKGWCETEGLGSFLQEKGHRVLAADPGYDAQQNSVPVAPDRKSE